MSFEELTIEIQAKSEELAHLCMDLGKNEALVDAMKQEKIRRAGELSRLFDELRTIKPVEKVAEEKKNEPVEEKKTAVKKQDPAKKIDMGKIVALRQAGWSAKKIADEVGLTEWEIRKALGMK